MDESIESHIMDRGGSDENEPFLHGPTGHNTSSLIDNASATFPTGFHVDDPIQIGNEETPTATNDKHVPIDSQARPEPEQRAEPVDNKPLGDQALLVRVSKYLVSLLERKKWKFLCVCVITVLLLFILVLIVVVITDGQKEEITRLTVDVSHLQNTVKKQQEEITRLASEISELRDFSRSLSSHELHKCWEDNSKTNSLSADPHWPYPNYCFFTAYPESSIKKKMNWFEAKEFCRHNHAALASPADEHQLNRIWVLSVESDGDIYLDWKYDVSAGTYQDKYDKSVTEMVKYYAISAERLMGGCVVGTNSEFPKFLRDIDCETELEHIICAVVI